VKVGAENRNKVLLAAGLGVLAVILAATQFGGWFGGNSSSAAAPAPTVSPEPGRDPLPTRRTAGRTRSGSAKKAAATASLDPTLRLDLLKASEDTKYEGSGRNIFKVFVEPPPKPIVPVVADKGASSGPPQPQLPPPPPPSNLKFYGFATPQGGTKRIFLTKNEDVFIAKEGEIVDRRYKVVRISPNSVEILDVLSNNRENIPLTPG
jgi:hypothetical protein